MAAPDVWDEVALVNISCTATGFTAEMNVACLTETINIDMGDKDGESIPSICGGRLWKKTPQADTSITFEGYPIDAGDTDATSPGGLMLHFFGSSDTTQPLSGTNSRARNTYRVTILWTDDSATGTARGTVTTACYALRYDFQNCYFVSCKPSFTDKVLKATWIFKCPAFNKAGTANMTAQSCDATVTLDTI